MSNFRRKLMLASAYGVIEILSVAVAKIPASGGVIANSVTSISYRQKYGTKWVTSGLTYKVQGGGQTIKSKGTTVSGETVVGSITVTVSGHGKSTSINVPVYQEANKFEYYRYPYGWLVLLSASAYSIDGEGGYTILSPSATRRRIPVYTSGSEGSESVENGTLSLSLRPSDISAGWSLSGTKLSVTKNPTYYQRNAIVTGTLEQDTSITKSAIIYQMPPSYTNIILRQYGYFKGLIQEPYYYTVGTYNNSFAIPWHNPIRTSNSESESIFLCMKCQTSCRVFGINDTTGQTLRWGIKIGSGYLNADRNALVNSFVLPFTNGQMVALDDSVELDWSGNLFIVVEVGKNDSGVRLSGTLSLTSMADKTVSSDYVIDIPLVQESSNFKLTAYALDSGSGRLNSFQVNSDLSGIPARAHSYNLAMDFQGTETTKEFNAAEIFDLIINSALANKQNKVTKTQYYVRNDSAGMVTLSVPNRENDAYKAIYSGYLAAGSSFSAEDNDPAFDLSYMRFYFSLNSVPTSSDLSWDDIYNNSTNGYWYKPYTDNMNKYGSNADNGYFISNSNGVIYLRPNQQLINMEPDAVSFMMDIDFTNVPNGTYTLMSMVSLGDMDYMDVRVAVNNGVGQIYTVEYWEYEDEPITYVVGMGREVHFMWNTAISGGMHLVVNGSGYNTGGYYQGIDYVYPLDVGIPIAAKVSNIEVKVG